MTMIRRIRVTFWVLCLSLSVQGLLLQNSRADEKVVLGLDALIERALKVSPEILQSHQDVAVAESEFAQADAARWAQLDATALGGAVEDAEKPVVKITRQTRRQPRAWVIPIEEGRDSDLETEVGPFGKLDVFITQPLYTFGKIVNRKEAAAHGVKAKRADLDKTRGDVILRVKELYYTLLLARQGKASAKDVNSFIEDLRSRVNKLLELGSASVDESDLYRLESFAADAKAAEVKAQSGARLTYLALKKMIGMPPEQDFKLDLNELPMTTQALEGEQKYIEKALEWRPEFEQIEQGLMAKRYLVDAEAAEYYPSIFAAAIGSLAGAPGREHLAEPYIGDDFNKSNIGAVLGAKWHFDLGITKGRVNKAQAQYQRLLYTKALAERDIPLEVTKHYQEVKEQKAAFQAYEQAASAARKWIVVSFANFDMGVGVIRDILDAIDRYGDNQGRFLRSLHKYHTAQARLSYVIGEYRAGSDALEPTD